MSIFTQNDRRKHTMFCINPLKCNTHKDPLSRQNEYDLAYVNKTPISVFDRTYLLYKTQCRFVTLWQISYIFASVIFKM
jgi:hypothetical protein